MTSTSLTDDERRVSKALVAGRDALEQVGKKAEGHDIVFQVLRDVAAIEKRLHISSPIPRPLRAQSLGYVTDKNDRADADKQRRIDIVAGDDPRLVWGVNLVATPAEVSTMDAVNTIFRSCLTGADRDNDWKILVVLASGYSTRHLSKNTNMSKSLLSERKIRQCKAIWARVSKFMFMPKPVYSTGKVWKDAA